MAAGKRLFNRAGAAASKMHGRSLSGLGIDKGDSPLNPLDNEVIEERA
jgi:hypothetical protein